MDTAENILIQKIQKGDQAAFERLFRNYYAALCDYARGYVEKPDIAEDQVQDVFVNIWDQRKEWNPKGTIKSYLYKAVRNQSLNYLKHRRIVEEWKQKEVSSSSPDVYPPTERMVDPEQIKKWMQQAIGQLPEKRRMVYELSRDHGLTYREIAKVMDISIKTVETQMARSLKHLRNRLREYLKK